MNQVEARRIGYDVGRKLARQEEGDGAVRAFENETRDKTPARIEVLSHAFYTGLSAGISARTNVPARAVLKRLEGMLEELKVGGLTRSVHKRLVGRARRIIAEHERRPAASQKEILAWAEERFLRYRLHAISENLVRAFVPPSRGPGATKRRPLTLEKARAAYDAAKAEPKVRGGESPVERAARSADVKVRTFRRLLREGRAQAAVVAQPSHARPPRRR